MKNDKQCQILDCAIKVFARFGIRKTSIDDIAKAADISRQGVYFHFKNKEEIFKASVEKYLSDRLEAVYKVLGLPLPLEDKLLKAMDEWFGVHVGFLHEDARDVIEQGKDVLGASFDGYSEKFMSALSITLETANANKTQNAQVTEILRACGTTWKHELKSREEFIDRMRGAIRICLLVF